MNRILDCISADWWVARWDCGWFPWWLVAIYLAANATIWISYEHIPFVLARLDRAQKKLFSDQRQSRSFITFIRACGRGHLLDGVLVFVWPNYFFFALWRAFTAVASVRTALSLHRLGSQLLSEQERGAVVQISETLRNISVESDSDELREIIVSLKLANETIERIFCE